MKVDISGAFDLHIHTAPDIRKRCVDDVEAARQAKGAGMAGILLKSHHVITSDRAKISEKVIPEIKVYGALALNYSVGGLNIFAVETALKLEAKEVFMPTISALNHIKKMERENRGITIIDDNQMLLPAVKDILSLIKEYDAILGTGHISKEEIGVLVKEAKKQGLDKIVITHPELPIVGLSTEEQLGLSGYGVYFERCYSSTFPKSGNVPLAQIARDIRKIGVHSTFLTTDLGRADYSYPVEGMRNFVKELMELGIKESEIEVMIRKNPRMLVEGKR